MAFAERSGFVQSGGEVREEALAERQDRRWALLVAVGVMAATLLPTLFALTLVGKRPGFGWYSWTNYYVTDACVYYAWIREAAEGHFFQQNLYNAAPQNAGQFSFFFAALGLLARLLPISIPVLYQLARLVLGVAFLRAVWWLLEMLLADRRARRAAFLTVCFSSGLGWLLRMLHLSEQGARGSVDIWQPEAITFLSLYFTPLFAVALLLMVGIIGNLYKAEQENSWRPALYAGICGFLLGNIHTYDVITVTGVWGAFLIVRGLLHRRFEAASWGRAVLAGVMTGVSSAYMFYVFKTGAVFAQRNATPTLLPPYPLVLLGLGLVFVLAVVTVAKLARGKWTEALQKNDEAANAVGSDASIWRQSDAALLLVAWAVMNLLLPIAPTSFQRKLLMGAHLPLAILAGVALWGLFQNRKGIAWTAALAAATILLSLSNWRFLGREALNAKANGQLLYGDRVYLYSGEAQAMDWLRAHTPPGTPVQPLPWTVRNEQGGIDISDMSLGLYSPSLSGRPVPVGHWCETSDYDQKKAQWRQFLLPQTADDWRRDWLRQSGARYLVFSQKHPDTDHTNPDNPFLRDFPQNPPAYLRLVPEASNPDADVYEVLGG